LFIINRIIAPRIPNKKAGSGQAKSVSKIGVEMIVSISPFLSLLILEKNLLFIL
jgi:hypothetical protein